MINLTLEQQRANHAWEAVNKGCEKEFKNLAKGAPALVMSNGLMPSLAFWQSKGKKEHKKLVGTLVNWLYIRKLTKEDNFNGTMDSLQNASSTGFMSATNETLEYLKWLRNFASAVNTEE